MKKLLLSAFVAATILSGCSTAYQIGQTPDDVYFSPGQETESYAVANNKSNNDERYQEYVSTMDDRYLRMRVANRNRWSTIDNFSYWNDMRYDFAPNNFNHFNTFNPWILDPYRFNFNPWSIGLGFRPGIYGWNNFYGVGWNGGLFGNPLGWGNPMFSVITYANPKASLPSYNSGSNLSAIRNRVFNNSNDPKWYTPGTSGGSNNFSNLVKRVFSSPSTSGGAGSSYDRSIRTFGNSSSSTIPSTSSSAGGASGGFKSTGSSASTGRGGRN